MRTLNSFSGMPMRTANSLKGTSNNDDFVVGSSAAVA
jgi:hypothetical protein